MSTFHPIKLFSETYKKLAVVVALQCYVCFWNAIYIEKKQIEVLMVTIAMDVSPK